MILWAAHLLLLLEVHHVEALLLEVLLQHVLRGRLLELARELPARGQLGPQPRVVARRQLGRVHQSASAGASVLGAYLDGREDVLLLRNSSRLLLRRPPGRLVPLSPDALLLLALALQARLLLLLLLQPQQLRLDVAAPALRWLEGGTRTAEAEILYGANQRASYRLREARGQAFPLDLAARGERAVALLCVLAAPVGQVL